MSAEEARPLSFDLHRFPAEHSYGLQYVSAALLALHPPPGFAAHLLANISILAMVLVVLPSSGQFGRGVVGDCFSSSERPRKDRPVTGQYTLSKQKSNGALLLVAPLWFQANQTRADSAPARAEFGASLNFFVKPLVKLDKISVVDLCDSKKRLLVLHDCCLLLPTSFRASTMPFF